MDASERQTILCNQHVGCRRTRRLASAVACSNKGPRKLESYSFIALSFLFTHQGSPSMGGGFPTAKRFVAR